MRNRIFNIAVLVALLLNLILIDKGPSYIPIRKGILILALIIGLVDLLLYKLYVLIRFERMFVTVRAVVHFSLFCFTVYIIQSKKVLALFGANTFF